MTAPAQSPGFRNYGEGTRAPVRELYRLNHLNQTLDFVRAQKRRFLSLDRRRLTVWQALELVETLVDDSDPDIDLGQIEHALQTAEAIRADGHPRWFVVTGLVHDLGKLLCSFGEPQWAVVGDTFPVGCAISAEHRAARAVCREPRHARARVFDAGSASTKKAAASTRWRCPGGTTSTSTRS